MSEARPELPSGKDPQEKPRTLWPSSIQPADPDPPPKRPSNYVSSGDAYALVSSMPFEVVVQLADGQTPTHMAWGGREVVMQYVRAARELISTKGNPVEINARMDGPVKQVVEKKGNDAETAAILALLSSLPPLPAQRRDGSE